MAVAGGHGGHAGAMPAPPLHIEFGVFLLDVSAIQQYQLAEVGGSRSADDLSPEALRRQSRQQATVIQMGMREQHPVQLPNIKAKVSVILLPGVVRPLVEATIDQKLTCLGLQIVHRAGNLAGRTQKLQCHTNLPYTSVRGPR